MSFQVAGVVVFLETPAVVQESTSLYSHSSWSCTEVILYSGCLSCNPDSSSQSRGKSFKKSDGKQAPCDTGTCI